MDISKAQAAFDTFLENRIVPLDKKIKLAIFAGAMILPVILFMFLYVSPKNEEIAQLTDKKSKLEKEIKVAKAKAAKLDEHQAEMAETEMRLREASFLLPQEKEIPSLLTNISSLGTSSGLDFLSFSPGGESRQEFYARIPIRISVRGPYHNVGTFLYRISKLGRIVSVASISLGSPKPEGGELLLGAGINLETYKFVEPREDEKKKKK